MISRPTIIQLLLYTCILLYSWVTKQMTYSVILLLSEEAMNTQLVRIVHIINMLNNVITSQGNIMIWKKNIPQPIINEPKSVVIVY